MGRTLLLISDNEIVVFGWRVCIGNSGSRERGREREICMKLDIVCSNFLAAQVSINRLL